MAKKTKKGAWSSVKTKFKCDVCQRPFKTKKGVENHKCAKLMCDHCGKSFERPSHLRRHVQNDCNALETSTESTDNKQDQGTTDGPMTRQSRPDDPQSELHKRNSTKQKRFKCEMCEKHFTYLSHFEQHLISHTSDRPFKCEKCDKRFCNGGNLKRHMRNLHSFPNAKGHGVCKICNQTFGAREDMAGHICFQCNICNVVFLNEGGLSRHQTRAQGKCSLACDVCEKKFTTLRRLNRHRKEVHNRQYQCPKCEQKLGSFSALNIHIKTHRKELCFKCDVCHKGYRSSSSLNQHKLTHTGKRFPCSKCKATFTQKSSLNAHMRTLHPIYDDLMEARDEDESYTCEVCGKKFHSLNNLNQHKVVHNVVRKYKCSQCGKKFKALRTFNEHKLIHTGIRFPCLTCEKDFSTPSYLKKHLGRVHKSHDVLGDTGEKGKSMIKDWCCEICTGVFETELGLKMHKDSGKCGPLVCELCGRRCQSVSKLIRHKLVHTKTLAYKCGDCGKLFRYLSSLNEHKRVHNGERPYACKQCNMRFVRSWTLKKHMKRHASKRKEFPCPKCGILVKNLTCHYFKRHLNEQVSRIKCTYCGQGFFKAWSYLRKHQTACAKKDDWRCAYCDRLFVKKELYMSHVRSFCSERDFHYKCYCQTSEYFDPENVVDVLKHVIKCKPAEHSSKKRCHICNHKFLPEIVSLHIQDELLHTRLIERSECTYECTMCLIAYPSEELLNLHNEEEHPCQTIFLKKFKEPVDDTGYPPATGAAAADILRQEREKNRKLNLKDLMVDGYLPQCQCYLCYLPFHCPTIRNYHERYCEKKYEVVPKPIVRPPKLPPSRLQLQRQRRRGIHRKITRWLAQKIFDRIKFDLLGYNVEWKEKVGTRFYWKLLGLEFRVPPDLLKKWLTTFTKAEKNNTADDNDTTLDSATEVSITIDWGEVLSRSSLLGITDSSDTVAISIDTKECELDVVRQNNRTDTDEAVKTNGHGPRIFWQIQTNFNSTIHLY